MSSLESNSSISAQLDSHKRVRQDTSDDEERLDILTQGKRHDFSGKRVRTTRWAGSASSLDEPRRLVIHQVSCKKEKVDGEDHNDHAAKTDYLDVPRLFAHDTRGSALRGTHVLADLDEVLEGNPGISVVIYKHYSCGEYHSMVKDSFENKNAGIDRRVFNRLRPWLFSLRQNGPKARPHSENIVLISQTLQEAMESVVSSDSERLSSWNAEHHLSAPYDYFYHFRSELRKRAPEILDQPMQQELNLLLDYIDECYGPVFDQVGAEFSSGVVHRRDFTKLFGPNELIVYTQDVYPQAYIAEKATLRPDGSLLLECWSWVYDGSFRKAHTKIAVPWPDTKTLRVSISRLTAWPLQFDDGHLRQRLESRGQSFWSCRNRRLVGYIAPTQTNYELQATNPKYMIDFNTYRQMHLQTVPPPDPNMVEMEQHGIDMNNDNSPPGNFCLLLPPTVFGYGFHDKKWRSLSIEHIRPVPWNKQAFNRLVLKSQKKEVIRALVTIHLATNQNADVVEGKGNGLIILLHGSPGTGKTLTAESVAELAEKPLYRVTCGDIGTDAEGVEKYLESVLLVGTIWDCVVLLDEADVFLEERQTTDLTRNALVSVFLRALEYYDGILILTSNRVGTFDEAFKSRVQLAVHYPALDDVGRLEIWRNFIQKLRDAKVDMNVDELERKVPILAHHKLNGRQIRNLIWSAKQLAKYKQERLEYTHLEQVIEIASEFEDYLVKTHGHTDDVYAKAQGIRSS